MKSSLGSGRRVHSKQRAWAVTFAVFFASIAVSANRFKPAPIMQVLMSDLNVDMVTGGWLTSVYSLAGVLLAIPTAFFLTRLGLKATGLLALGCAVAGSVVGALATSASMLLAGRIIEGISVGLISVVAPAAISMWFGARERGMPMGLWATWVPVGNVITFNVAHPLLNAFGWRAVWWFGALLSFSAFVVFALVVSEPARPAAGEQAAAAVEAGTRDAQRAFGTFARTLLNLPTWLLGLAFGAFGFAIISYNTWAPTYLTETLGIVPAAASSYASLLFLAAIPGNLVAGWAVDRTAHRHRLLSGSFLVTGILLAWSFSLGSTWMVVPYMLLLGFVSNWIPSVVFALAPEKVPSVEFAGLGVAIVITCGNVGSLVGPPAMAGIVNGGNWAAGSVWMVLVMAVGLLLTLAVWRLSRRPARSQAAGAAKVGKA